MQVQLEILSNPRSTRRAVLVVDRYQAGRQAICASLAELGYAVVPIGELDELHAVLDTAVIDLIVADIDDRETRELVASLHALRAPIGTVMMTTHPERFVTSPTVMKPFSLEVLASAITLALAMRDQLDLADHPADRARPARGHWPMRRSSVFDGIDGQPERHAVAHAARGPSAALWHHRCSTPTQSQPHRNITERATMRTDGELKRDVENELE